MLGLPKEQSCWDSSWLRAAAHVRPLSSEPALEPVRQDYSFAKKQASAPALLVVVRSGASGLTADAPLQRPLSAAPGRRVFRICFVSRAAREGACFGRRSRSTERLLLLEPVDSRELGTTRLLSFEAGAVELAVAFGQAALEVRC